MKLKTPTQCPVCGGTYETTVLTCTKCKSQLSGHFSGCEFCKLSSENANFLMTFVKCRGSIKDVEKELGISYPTVRGKLDNLIKSLGLDDEKNRQEIKQNRQEIFDKLSSGEIDADKAAELLKNT